MTSGGPGEDTALIAYRITTEAFTNLNVGYASALALSLIHIYIRHTGKGCGYPGSVHGTPADWLMMVPGR